MGPVDYSLVELAELLKKKYQIDDDIYEEIRMLASCASNVVLPKTEEYRKTRMARIKKIGDKWNNNWKSSHKNKENI